VPFIESGVSSDGRRSGLVLGGTPHNDPFSSSEFPSRASISCELNELDTNQPRENVCLRGSTELFRRRQTGYSRDQGACRLSSLKKKARNPSPSALFSHSFQPDHRVLRGEPGPPRSSLFSLLYSGLRISRASGEVKCWFPALLFGDQKMVSWCDRTHHPSRLVTIKSLFAFLKALRVTFHYAVNISQMVGPLFNQGTIF